MELRCDSVCRRFLKEQMGFPLINVGYGHDRGVGGDTAHLGRIAGR